MKRLAKHTLRRLGYRVSRVDDDRTLHGNSLLDAVLWRRFYQSPDFFFVQIGANDGVHADPIRDFVTQHRVRGLVVEPIRETFDRLVHNYRDYPGVIPVNAAIHATEKALPMYRINPTRETELPGWVKGIASFRKNHLSLNPLMNIPDTFIVEEQVACMTLSELLERYHVENIDLLQTDTEGYDFDILKMIDFTRHKPHLIHFEHGLKHGLMSWEQMTQCLALLYRQDYCVAVEHYDAIAYLP